MERVLMTGATGLIGQELLSILLMEYECWIIGREKSVSNEQVHFVKQDLSKEIDFSVFPSHLDYIIYLAQGDGHNDFPNSAVDVFNVNVGGVVQLLDYGRKVKVKKFLFASTGGVYNNNGKKMSEDDVSFPIDLNFYQSTKLCSEIIAKNYSQFFVVISFRFYFVYGENQKSNMLFPRLINHIKSGKTIKIHSLNDIKINPIYKSDAAFCIYMAMKNIEETSVFNIAGDEEIYISEIVNQIARKLEMNVNISFEDKRENDILGNNDKMKKYLREPKVKLGDGISRMVLSVKNRSKEEC